MTAEPGLTLTIHTAEPGSPSEEALRLLATWAASQEADPTPRCSLRNDAARKLDEASARALAAAIHIALAAASSPERPSAAAAAEDQP